MFIVAQSRKLLINLDNMLGIYIKENAIETGETNGILTIGTYKTKERAAKVFEYIANSIDLGRNIITMPEE